MARGMEHNAKLGLRRGGSQLDVIFILRKNTPSDRPHSNFCIVDGKCTISLASHTLAHMLSTFSSLFSSKRDQQRAPIPLVECLPVRQLAAEIEGRSRIWPMSSSKHRMHSDRFACLGYLECKPKLVKTLTVVQVTIFDRSIFT